MCSPANLRMWAPHWYAWCASTHGVTEAEQPVTKAPLALGRRMQTMRMHAAELARWPQAYARVVYCVLTLGCARPGCRSFA